MRACVRWVGWVLAGGCRYGYASLELTKQP
eukprot:SAG25_NODE_10808_length_322_cov_0.901345_1_plen_29_part_10